MEIKSEVAQVTDDDESEVYIPEEAFHLLPDEIRAHYEAVAKDGRDILDSVSKELNRASKISRSMSNLASLRHVQERISSTPIAVSMGYILELDMLTTAFVVTYVRVLRGGGGVSFDRKDLPEHLRAIHDEIVDLRNKRFAHDDADHHSVTNVMEINSAGDGFEIHSGLSKMYQFGGSPLWKDLVEAIEGIYIEKAEKLVTAMTVKTGRTWTFAQQPE